MANKIKNNEDKNMTNTNDWVDSINNTDNEKATDINSDLETAEPVSNEEGAEENKPDEVTVDGDVLDEQGNVIEPEPLPDSFALVTYDNKNHAMQAGGMNSGALDFIRSLSKQTYEQLLGTFTTAINSERVMFVVRGATAHELYVRACSKEKREFSNKLGGGIDTFMKEISKEVGVDAKTLYKDFQIFDVFGETLMEYLADSPDRILPREFYALACNTSENVTTSKMETLEYFEMKREQTDSYFTDHARRDIKLINQGVSIMEVSEDDNKARAEALAGVKKTNQTKTKDKYVSVNIVANHENDWLLREVIKKYGSVSTFFTKRAKEEFGDAPKPEPPVKTTPKSKVAPKGKTKTAPKATTKGKTAPKGKGKTTTPKATGKK